MKEARARGAGSAAQSHQSPGHIGHAAPLAQDPLNKLSICHAAAPLLMAPYKSAGTSTKGVVPESWCCIDCGFNTAPGLLIRAEMDAAIEGLGSQWDAGVGVEQTIGFDSEVYCVRITVWKRAGMQPMGGCLCIGCLEKRLGRRLKPKDFQRGHPFNALPGTARLLKRRGDYPGCSRFPNGPLPRRPM
jgi:hypothetical protein